MALEHVVDRVWGTWYHEEFERYDFKSRVSCDEDFDYRVYTDHATVTKKRSPATVAIVPDTVEGLPVTGVADSVFNRSRYTEEVLLPCELANIRYCAFYKADKIARIDVPSSVRVIYDSAFSTCANLRAVHINPGCIHIGFRAFGNCPNLEAVVVPDTVRQIEGEAFLNCKKLTLYGGPGSFAESYAASAGIPFVSTGQASSLAMEDSRESLRNLLQENERLSCALIEVETGSVLFEHQGCRRGLVASLGKTALAYFALRALGDDSCRYGWDDPYVFGKEVAFEKLGGAMPAANGTARGRVDGMQAYLEPGESMTMGSLLHAMMVADGDDAASAVAVAAAGSEEDYLKWANSDMLVQCGMSDQTHFGRAHGRDCYSTAIDMARLVRNVLLDRGIAEKFWEIAGAPTTDGKVEIFKKNGGIERVCRRNAHSFVAGSYRAWLERAVGGGCRICGKTGTLANDYALMTAVEYGGRTFASVVLGASSIAVRDEVTLALLGGVGRRFA